MTEAPLEQGPQALVLRSLLRGVALPGGRYPVRLGDLPLARTAHGSVRLVADGLEPGTARALGADADLAVEISPAEQFVIADGAGSAGVLRSEVDYPELDRARVQVEVCDAQSAELTVWESFVAELVRTPEGWMAHGDPLHLAT